MLVGVHWEQAGEPARAAALYARAGDRANEAFAFDRAVKLYERCLSLAPDMSAQLRSKLGVAYANAGRGREAADVFLALARESKIAADALELEQKAAHELYRMLETLTYVADAVVDAREQGRARAAKLPKGDALAKKLAGWSDQLDALHKTLVTTREGRPAAEKSVVCDRLESPKGRQLVPLN